MRLRKSALILALVVILFNSATAQVFAQSQPTTPQTPPQQCFKQDECATGKYKNSFAVASQECAAFLPYTYNCISSPPPVKLNTPLAGLTEITGLQNYIVIIYKFLIGSAGILAGIMIVIAGFEWLTAAGESGKIKHARERIMNALIGLVLALGSYTILYTINPALLSLQLAPIKMIRETAIDTSTLKRWQACDPNNQTSQQKCAATCPGCVCLAFTQVTPECGFITTGANIVLAGATIATLAIPLPGTAITGIQAIWNTGKLIWKIPGSGLAGGYFGGKWVYDKISQEDANLTGMCVNPAEDTGKKGTGGPCSTDQECTSGYCKPFNRCSIFGGVCADGKLQSPCDPNGRACIEGTCIETKVVGSYSTFQCSNGSWGGFCNQNAESICGNGLKCSRNGVCIKTDAPIQEGEACRSNWDCLADQSYSGLYDGWVLPARCLLPSGQFRDAAVTTGDIPDGICTNGIGGSPCSKTATSPCKNYNIATCMTIKYPSGSSKTMCAPKSEFLGPCEYGANGAGDINCGGGLLCRPPRESGVQYLGVEIVPTGICLYGPQRPCEINDDCASGRCTSGRCET